MKIVDEGIVPKLIDLLKDWHHPQLQLEAADTLTNICAGTTFHCRKVV